MRGLQPKEVGADLESHQTRGPVAAPCPPILVPPEMPGVSPRLSASTPTLSLMVEQGLSFTMIDASRVQELAIDGPWPDPRKEFTFARRVWLGWTPGVDWLHEAIEHEFGEDMAWYDVESKRKGVHIGASGETAAVVLILLSVAGIEFMRRFSGRLGERSADGLIDWVREQAARRRKEKGLDHADPGPDFSISDPDDLARGMTSELADLIEVPVERLELVQHERRADIALVARYRDTDTGEEYDVEVVRDEAIFTRVTPPE
jgi:hypothetical protein